MARFVRRGETWSHKVTGALAYVATVVMTPTGSMVLYFDAGPEGVIRDHQSAEEMLEVSFVEDYRPMDVG